MLDPVIGEILPPAVAVGEAFSDDEPAALFPVEEEAIARAVAKRRREFATGRACARVALARLGLPPAAIPRGERGDPQWPSGVVGSITHCAGYRAGAVAWRRDVQAIGLDAEPHGPLPNGVLNTVASPAEQARLAELAAADARVHWDRLLFSAKESVYKAWFPLTGQWLGFDGAAIDFDPGSGQFTARILLDDPPIKGFEGRWRVEGGLLATAIAVPA
jgi:enterobactin synthetase component D / holo-[acyl-carrier protein] synthase